MLKIDYTFHSLLSDKELKPYLSWWTSANKGLYKESNINYNKKDGISEERSNGSVMIDIRKKETSYYSYDDSVRVECISYAESSAYRLARIKSGCSYFLVREAVLAILDKGKYETELAIILPTTETKKGALVKGKLKLNVTVDESQRKNLTRIKFNKPTKYDLIVENKEYLEMIGVAYANRTTLPFIWNDLDDQPFDLESQGISDFDFRGIEPNIGLHVPLIKNEVFPIPIWSYWVNPDPSEISEESFMLRLLDLSLDRNGMKKGDFINAIKNQFNSKASKITPMFLRALLVIAITCTLVSNSLPYIADETFVKGKKKIIESFHSAFRMKDGDCEDLGGLACRIAVEIKIGDPRLRDPNFEYTKHGSWADEGLREMQKVLFLYLVYGSLGSVTSAYLGQNDGKSAKLPIIIDSESDKNVKIGFHIWGFLHPLKFIEACIERTNPDNEMKMYPSMKRYSWENDLPVLTLEGTGQLMPLLRPYQDYFQTDIEKQNAVEYISDIIAMLKRIFMIPKSFKKGSIERKQGLLKDVENSRLSTFYREPTHMYTAEFILEGYNIAEFTWLTIGEKGKRVWGANMRHVVLQSNNLGLLITPGYTEEEFKLVKSVQRHLPPQGKLALKISEQRKKQMNDLLNTLRNKFNITETSETTLRKGKTNIYFCYEHLLNVEFQNQLKKDMDTITEIKKIDIFCEIIEEEIINFRFELTMTIPTQEDLSNLETEAKKQRKADGGNSDNESEEEEESSSDDSM
jgi:hypothetical protein